MGSHAREITRLPVNEEYNASSYDELHKRRVESVFRDGNAAGIESRDGRTDDCRTYVARGRPERSGGSGVGGVSGVATHTGSRPDSVLDQAETVAGRPGLHR